MNTPEIINTAESNNSVGAEKEATQIKDSITEKKDGLSIYYVAHDLKGLIGRISGLNSLLRVKLVNDTNSEVTEYSNMINSMCEQGNQMISDFIFKDSLNHKKDYQQTRSLVLLNDLIQCQSRIHQLLAHKKEIELIMIIPEENIYCFVNTEDIKRVIDNLLSNAVKFTSREGNIRVELHVFIESVVMEISDSGIGIPMELQKELFFSYTKAKRLGTENEYSTGLGLTIAKKIIEMNDGTISLNSSENIGTTVSVEFKRIV